MGQNKTRGRHVGSRRRHLPRVINVLGCVGVLMAGAVAMTAPSAAGARSGHQKAGGTLTVLESATFIGN